MSSILAIRKNNKGGGMVLGFVGLMFVITLGVSLLTMSASTLLTSKRDMIRAAALASAEAGVDKAESFLMEGGPYGEAAGEWRGSYQDESLGNGQSYRVCALDGSGVTQNKIVITSTGTATRGNASISRTIKVVVSYKKQNVGVWNNVIFGGVGQAGKSINGNVAIRGSVHLLGDGEEFNDLDNDGHWDDAETYSDYNGNGQYDLGEPFIDKDGDGHRDGRESFSDINGNGTCDPPLTVTDMASEISGNANMGNNYDAMTSGLRTHLPALPTVSQNGNDLETLSAILRVKHGKVNISGSATVGTFQTSNLIKETMDGVYVSDGFGGNAGTSSVYSDNGYSNGYDLGDDLVKMPTIDDESVTVNGVTYTNYLSYLKANATVVSGDLNISDGTAQSIVGPNGSLVIDADGNMTISGIVYVTGNISFGPSKSQINYSGSGSLVTPNSAFVHCNLMPSGMFPTNGVLGLVAGDRIELATGSGDSQLTMALAMYAQHKVISVKQSQIAGTLVSSYYSMSNVPSIYQVPELVDNLPPGMPGSDPIWVSSISVEGWEEI